MLKRILLVGIVIVLALVFAPLAFAQAEDDGAISDLLMYSALVGFFLPPVLSIVMQSMWSDRFKAVVAFGACLIAGAGTAYLEDDLTGRTWVSSSLLVLTTGLATYRNFWKPTGIAPGIEKRTNVTDEGGGK